MVQFLRAIYKLLHDQGLRALITGQTHSFPRLKGPMIAIAMESYREEPASADGRLAYEAGSLEGRGRAVHARILLTVYTPYRGGTQGAEDAVSTVLTGLQQGIPQATVTGWEQSMIHYDPDVDTFVSTVTVNLEALELSYTSLGTI